MWLFFIRASVKCRYGFDAIKSTSENDLKAAIIDYSKAIELGGLEQTPIFNDFEFKSAYFFRGYVKMFLYDFDSAIIDFNKSISLFPTDGLNNLIFCIFKKF